MKFNPLPADVGKLRTGSHIWIKKVESHNLGLISMGYEAKGYMLQALQQNNCLIVGYYWCKKNSELSGRDRISFFHTSLIVQVEGHVLVTLNSQYEVYDLGTPVDVPDFETVLKEIYGIPPQI
jgi:hypothetical protein